MSGGALDAPSPRAIAAAWAPALAYMALIFVVSSIRVSVPDLGNLPMRDKIVHFFEYGVLGVLCAHAAIRTWPTRARWRTAALGALVTVAFGVSDEIHQSFVPGRDADVLDVVADALGAAVGAAGYAWALRARGSAADRGAAGSRAE